LEKEALHSNIGTKHALNHLNSLLPLRISSVSYTWFKLWRTRG